MGSAVENPTSRKAREVGHPLFVNDSRFHLLTGEVGHRPKTVEVRGAHPFAKNTRRSGAPPVVPRLFPVFPCCFGLRENLNNETICVNGRTFRKTRNGSALPRRPRLRRRAPTGGAARNRGRSTSEQKYRAHRRRNTLRSLARRAGRRARADRAG